MGEGPSNRGDRYAHAMAPVAIGRAPADAQRRSSRTAQSPISHSTLCPTQSVGAVPLNGLRTQKTYAPGKRRPFRGQELNGCRDPQHGRGLAPDCAAYMQSPGRGMGIGPDWRSRRVAYLSDRPAVAGCPGSESGCARRRADTGSVRLSVVDWARRRGRGSESSATRMPRLT